MELAEYTRILPKMSGIPYLMYIDESSSYKRWGHPLWMIVSDGDPYCDKWVAISISADPHILTVGNQLTHSEGELSDKNECMEFVAKFHAIISDIATEETDSGMIYDILEHHVWKDLTTTDISNLRNQLNPVYSLNLNRSNETIEASLQAPDGEYRRKDK